MNIPFLLGQSLGTALITGTFLFYLLKGFVNPQANWFFVVFGTFIGFMLFFIMSYPNSPLENPLINVLNGLLFIGGIAGAIKYYRNRKKNITN